MGSNEDPESKVKVLVTQSCLPLGDPMDCSPPGSFVHGVSQARKLEWVAISFFRGSPWPRDWTQVSHSTVWLYHLRQADSTVWATREAAMNTQCSHKWKKNFFKESGVHAAAWERKVRHKVWGPLSITFSYLFFVTSLTERKKRNLSLKVQVKLPQVYNLIFFNLNLISPWIWKF